MKTVAQYKVGDTFEYELKYKKGGDTTVQSHHHKLKITNINATTFQGTTSDYVFFSTKPADNLTPPARKAFSAISQPMKFNRKDKL